MSSNKEQGYWAESKKRQKWTMPKREIVGRLDNLIFIMDCTISDYVIDSSHFTTGVRSIFVLTASSISKSFHTNICDFSPMTCCEQKCDSAIGQKTRDKSYA